MAGKIKIVSAKQISIQKPLSEEWMESPLSYTEQFVRAVDPDFKQFISAGDARRMGKLLKRALATSLSALNEAGTEHPDAIITGTGFGSVENTELFLNAMVREGEQMLKPTQFMQSTHNTASSLIGIHTHSQGYNSTYSQKGLSFDCALYDAWLQFRLAKIETALVGGHDEMTPVFESFMRKAEHLLEGEICSESAVSLLLSNAPQSPALCTLEGLVIMDRPEPEELAAAIESLTADCQPQAIMTGMSGNRENDKQYDFLDRVLPGVAKLQYKPLFGVNFSSSGIGFYAAACCIKNGVVPSGLTMNGVPFAIHDGLLVVNAVEGRHYSIALLRG